METPETLPEVISHFQSFANCKAFLTALRWPDGVVRCPHCQSTRVTWLEPARLWKCYGGHRKAKFSLKTGSIFEDSPLSLEKWLSCVWLIVNSNNRASSWEIHRRLGVTQKTAWFMLHRIRLALQDNWNAETLSAETDPGAKD